MLGGRGGIEALSAVVAVAGVAAAWSGPGVGAAAEPEEMVF
jgi:hypothetical protein